MVRVLSGNFGFEWAKLSGLVMFKFNTRQSVSSAPGQGNKCAMHHAPRKVVGLLLLPLAG